MCTNALKEIRKLAEIALCDVNDVLEYGSLTLDGEEAALKSIRDSLCRVLVGLDQALAREVLLQTAVDDLCELQEKEEEREESGNLGPRPDWGQAWEQAFAMRYGAAQAATTLVQ